MAAEGSIGVQVDLRRVKCMKCLIKDACASHQQHAIVRFLWVFRICDKGRAGNTTMHIRNGGVLSR